MESCMKELDVVAVAPAIVVAGAVDAVGRNVKSEYCCCSSLTPPCTWLSGAVAAVAVAVVIQLNNAPVVVGDGNKLGVRRIGESRNPEDETPPK